MVGRLCPVGVSLMVGGSRELSSFGLFSCCLLCCGLIS